VEISFLTGMVVLNPNNLAKLVMLFTALPERVWNFYILLPLMMTPFILDLFGAYACSRHRYLGL